MDHGEEEGTSIQTGQTTGDTKGSMTLTGEGSVTNLGGLESDNHVGSRTQHGKVTGNGGRERNLHPIVRSGIGEGSGKHLHNGNVGGNVGKNGNNHHEPVHARNGGHLIGTSTHGDREEGLRNTGIIKGTDEQELANEKHEQTVINLGKSGLGLGNELLLLGLDLVAVHVVRLLDGEGVALGIVLGVVGAGIVVLTLVGGHDHEDGTGADGDDADVETESEEDEEDQDDEDLKLGPDGPSGGLLALLGGGLLDGGLTGVVGILLGEHLGSLLAGEHDAKVLDDAGGTGEQLGAVVDEHHGGVDDGGGDDGKDHVGGELGPANVVVGKGNDEDVLGVAGHGKAGTDVGGGGEREEVGEGVGDLWCVFLCMFEWKRRERL